MVLQRSKVIVTAVLFYCFVALGISSTFLSPVLTKYAALLHTDVAAISVAYAIEFSTTVLSSLLFGLLYDHVSRHVFAAGHMLLLGSSMAALPLSSSVTFLYVASGMKAVAFGGFNTAASVWIMEVWAEKPGPFIQAQHFCFALGTIITPLIYLPYISDTDTNATDYFALSLTATSPANVTHRLREQLYPAGQITGAVFCLGGLMLMVLYAFGMDGKHNLYRESHLQLTSVGDERGPDDTSCVPMTLKRRAILIAVFCLFLGLFKGMELSVLQLYPTFIHFAGGFPSADGAVFLSAVTLSFTLSRLLGIFVATKVSAVHMLCFNFVVLTAAHGLLVVTEAQSANWILASSILLGVGFSTGIASIFDYYKEFVPVTNNTGAILIAAGNIMTVLWIVLIGHWIEGYAFVLVYLNLTAIGCCTLILWALVILKRSC